jgi:FKBP-type peptidyl-prolyl cis-trans isomerase FklB
MRLGLAVVLSIALLGCEAGKQDKLELKTEKDKLSYSIGYSFGMNINQTLQVQSIEADPNIIAQGVRFALIGGDTLMTEAEMNASIVAFQTRRRTNAKQQAEESKKTGEESKKTGEAFLVENKNKEGVVTLPSGLQYKILKAGTGKTPMATSKVTVHYRGTFIDGSEFDSSYKRGQPASFPVNDVISGWTEALQLMKVGAKWQLFIPSGLAYGERGRPGIPPNSVLIFEVELLEIG